MTPVQSRVEEGYVVDGAQSFRDFFTRNFDYVCRSLRRNGVRERDLDDLAQEVFVRVHARFAQLNPEDDPRPWLWAFVANVASNYRRLARHRHELDHGAVDDLRASLDSKTPEDDAVAAQTRQHVLHALEAVKEERRGVLVLHDVEGVTASAIATAMSLPVNTVYSRLRLAREDFRSAIRELGGEL